MSSSETEPVPVIRSPIKITRTLSHDSLLKATGLHISSKEADVLLDQLYRLADVITDKILASPTDTYINEKGTSRRAKSELLELSIPLEIWEMEEERRELLYSKWEAEGEFD